MTAAQKSTQARILEALPGTLAEIAQKLGIGQTRVGLVIKQMARLVFISGWRRPAVSGQWAAIYSPGAGCTPEQPKMIRSEQFKRAAPVARSISVDRMGESSVSFAIRTQPKSVFGLACMAGGVA